MNVPQVYKPTAGVIISALALLVGGTYLAADSFFLGETADVYGLVAGVFILDVGIMFLIVPIVPKMLQLLIQPVLRWSLIIPPMGAVLYAMLNAQDLYGLLMLPLMVLGYSRYGTD